MTKPLIWLFILLSTIACKNRNATLKNQQIVISAPSIYASRLKGALEKYEAKVILMPAIETIIYDSIPQLKALNQNIRPQLCGSSKYDYIVLPSRNAIKAFDNEIQRNSAFKEWQSGPYYVIGKDIELLQSLGYSTTAKVLEPSLKGITKTIAADKKGKGNKHLLLISPQVQKMKEPPIVPDFIASIKAIGIECHQIYGYTSQGIHSPNNTLILENITQGKYDLLALTSGGESFAIAQQINPSDVKCKVACFGPYTAKSAKQAGFKIDLISDKYHSFDDYAKAICQFLNQ